jgi:hypothetical protein
MNGRTALPADCFEAHIQLRCANAGHGQLDRAPHVLRTPAAENRVEWFDCGVLPCAGAYLSVIGEGTIGIGEPISLG